MEDLKFAVLAVAPIVLMVTVGYLLKRTGFMSRDFAKAANRLVFRVFLPVLLFLNVYQLESFADLDYGYLLYAVAAVLVLFAGSLPLVLAVTKDNTRRGPLWQAVFRSNYALIGIPLAQALYGEAGVTVAGLLSAVVIPLFNVLAVVSLTVFSGGAGQVSPRKVLRGVVTNPLIWGVGLGLVTLGLRAGLVRAGIGFRLTDLGPIFDTAKTLSTLATPMALLVLGAQFEFSAIPSLRREILWGTLIRTVLVPILGLGTAVLFFRDSFDGARFAALVAMFATPVAVSSVPMAQEMGGDVKLAGQLVVWTTLVSAVVVFLAAWALKAMGLLD